MGGRARPRRKGVRAQGWSMGWAQKNEGRRRYTDEIHQLELTIVLGLGGGCSVGNGAGKCKRERKRERERNSQRK